jgi:DNA mismatch repair ATPase MutS
MVDKSSTAIGRRLLKERLLNPIMEKDELERRYNLIERVSSHIRFLDETMRGIYDIERLSRRLALGRLHPFEINHIYESIQLNLLNSPEILNKEELSNAGITLRNSVSNSLVMPYNIYEENDSFVEADMFWKSGFNGKTKNFTQDLLEGASWIEKSQSEIDPVKRFILLYIAFNGLYSHFSRSVTKTKKDDPKSEFNKILKELLGEEEAGKIVKTYRQQLNTLVAFNLVTTGKKSEKLSKMLKNIMQKETVNNLCVVFAATRCIHQIRIELFHYGTHMLQRRQKVETASQILLGIIARCMKYYVNY